MSKEHLIALWCVFLHEGLISGNDMNAREREVLEAADTAGEGALEFFSRLPAIAEKIYEHIKDDLDMLRLRPPIFEYDVISLLGRRLGAMFVEVKNFDSVFDDENVLVNLDELISNFLDRRQSLLKTA